MLKAAAWMILFPVVVALKVIALIVRAISGASKVYATGYVAGKGAQAGGLGRSRR